MGWALSRPLYVAPLALVVVLCVAWGGSVGFAVRFLIDQNQPSVWLRWIMGYALGAYVAIPNYGLIRPSTIPPNAIPRHNLISNVPPAVYIIVSILLAWIPSGWSAAPTSSGSTHSSPSAKARTLNRHLATDRGSAQNAANMTDDELLRQANAILQTIPPDSYTNLPKANQEQFGKAMNGVPRERRYPKFPVTGSSQAWEPQPQQPRPVPSSPPTQPAAPQADQPSQATIAYWKDKIDREKGCIQNGDLKESSRFSAATVSVFV